MLQDIGINQHNNVNNVIKDVNSVVDHKFGIVKLVKMDFTLKLIKLMIKKFIDVNNNSVKLNGLISFLTTMLIECV